MRLPLLFLLLLPILFILLILLPGGCGGRGPGLAVWGPSGSAGAELPGPGAERPFGPGSRRTGGGDRGSGGVRGPWALGCPGPAGPAWPCRPSPGRSPPSPALPRCRCRPWAAGGGSGSPGGEKGTRALAGCWLCIPSFSVKFIRGALGESRCSRREAVPGNAAAAAAARGGPRAHSGASVSLHGDKRAACVISWLRARSRIAAGSGQREQKGAVPVRVQARPQRLSSVLSEQVLSIPAAGHAQVHSEGSAVTCVRSVLV